MAIRKTEAFILRTFPFRTSSLIVTVFTRDFGKIRGVAKGVRGEGVARPGTFEPFTRVEVVFYEKLRSELHLITETNTLCPYEKLRSQLEILATAYSFCELVDQFTEPHDPQPAIFDLLGFAFDWLPSLPPSFLSRFFEIRLLSEVGFLPHLDHCLGCREREPQEIYFSSRQGGIFCGRCRRRAPEARRITRNVLDAVERFASGKPDEVIQNLLGGETEKELERLVEHFLLERVGKKLSTRRFLKQIHSLRPYRDRHSSRVFNQQNS